jgi:hypothetical protein
LWVGHLPTKAGHVSSKRDWPNSHAEIHEFVAMAPKSIRRVEAHLPVNIIRQPLLRRVKVVTEMATVKSTDAIADHPDDALCHARMPPEKSLALFGMRFGKHHSFSKHATKTISYDGVNDGPSQRSRAFTGATVTIIATSHWIIATSHWIEV